MFTTQFYSTEIVRVFVFSFRLSHAEEMSPKDNFYLFIHCIIITTITRLKATGGNGEGQKDRLTNYVPFGFNPRFLR